MGRYCTIYLSIKLGTMTIGGNSPLIVINHGSMSHPGSTLMTSQFLVRHPGWRHSKGKDQDPGSICVIWSCTQPLFAAPVCCLMLLIYPVKHRKNFVYLKITHLTRWVFAADFAATVVTTRCTRAKPTQHSKKCA